MAFYLEKFNQFYMPAISDTLDQAVEQFNAASGNTIVLSGSTGIGDFIETSFYDLLSAPTLIDITGTNTTNSVEDVSQSKIRRVKLASTFPVRSFEKAQMDWLNKPSAEALNVISMQMTSRIMQLQLNSAIGAAVAAIESEGALTVKDVSGTGGIDTVALAQTDALFGDAGADLRARFMHSGQANKLIIANITNATQLFSYDSVRVVDILGKLVVITDSPYLVGSTGSPAVPTYKVLTLVENAVSVAQGNLINSIVDSVTNNRITTNFGTNYNFEVGVKGYSWTGAASPTAAMLIDDSNWTLQYGSVKNGAGVVSIGRQA